MGEDVEGAVEVVCRPGFSLSLGFTVTYLSLIVLVPLAAVSLMTATMLPSTFWDVVTSPRVVATYKLKLRHCAAGGGHQRGVECDGGFAACLGATRWQTIVRVVFPPPLPAMLSGFALAFAPAVGEYGSVIITAGNLPMNSGFISLIMSGGLDQSGYAGATEVACVVLVASWHFS